MNEIVHCLKLSKDREIYVLLWEKCNFEHIGNSVHTAELLALGKILNIYIDYLMFCSSRKHVKWKHFKYKFTFKHDFMMDNELN